MRKLCRCLFVCAVLLAPSAPWLGPVGGIVAASSPAAAQSSGGYARPGAASSSGGYGGYNSFNRRPAVGSGGYGRPSNSSFGGLGLDSSRGGDRAISRRASNQALQDYRASQAGPASSPLSTTRRPSGGWDDNGWATAPSRQGGARTGAAGGCQPHRDRHLACQLS